MSDIKTATAGSATETPVPAHTHATPAAMVGGRRRKTSSHAHASPLPESDTPPSPDTAAKYAEARHMQDKALDNHPDHAHTRAQVITSKPLFQPR
ncbi:hypothetical protein H9P43_009948 [Blastocladiella emersonii ATCC 22665]|nr:hypothetical protein H9P43_009948 [Blastocladiella emersonii ATCC 22665]